MRTIFVVATLSVSLVPAQVAFAQTSSGNQQSQIAYECNLSGYTGVNLSGCPNNPDLIGKLTTKAVTGVVTGNNNPANIICPTTSAGVPPYCGARSDSTAVAPIDAWGTCRWVDNAGTNAIFVPFRTNYEWQDFLTAATSLTGIGITPCAEPQSETQVTSPVSTVPTYDSTCAGVVTGGDGTIAVPNVYGRVGPYGALMTSLYPASPASQNFTCHGGATSITSLLQWYAGNVNWASSFVYSPDLVLTAGPSSTPSTPVDAGTQVMLSWGTDGTAVSCTASDNNQVSDAWNVNSWTAATNTPLPTVSNTANVIVTPNVTTIYTVTCTGTKGLISTANVTVYIAQPVNGVCGSTVNGQTLSSAPSGGELCNTGAPTVVSGSGPWTWTCQGASGGTDSPTCTANNVPQVCPAVVTQGDTNSSSNLPIDGGIAVMTFTGVTGQIDIQATTVGNPESPGFYDYASYFNGKCTASWPRSVGDTITVTIEGKTETGSYDGDPIGTAADADPGSPYYDFVQCIATDYAQQYLPGYAKCTPSPVSGNAYSPLKVSLSGGDAKMNSSTPTTFLLTLKDGRTLEGHVKGGLNADEGWLMVKRSKAPFVFDSGMLNANDWFGDRDHRSLNGYTDLAETFGAFVTKDDSGQRYIPLHVLTDAEKSRKIAEVQASNEIKVTDPSFDLRIVDADNEEHFASDYFDRIYVDYRSVVEGDGKDGRSGDNLILERGILHTLQGENHGAVDQWFKLDLLADYSSPANQPTQSKVWPAATSTQ